MRTAYSVETVRAAERELMARLPEGALMQRAAAGLAAACADVLGRVYGSRVVLLVGSGDNGGDALYAGARLARRGAGVRAVLLAPGRAHAWGGLAALRRAGGGSVVEAGASGVRLVEQADLVVDGIVGIGGKGGLREEAVPLAEAARRGRGLSSPSICRAGSTRTRGGAGAAVRADVTVTFGAYKPGLLIDPAREYAGVVRFVDIGLELGLGGAGAAQAEALQHADVARLLPVLKLRKVTSTGGGRGDRGRVRAVSGAAVLAVAGALRGGGGGRAVRGAGGRCGAGPASRDAGVGAGASAGGAGAGVGRRAGGGDDAATVAEALAADVPVLIDADGLRLAEVGAVRGRGLGGAHVDDSACGGGGGVAGVEREVVEAGRLGGGAGAGGAVRGGCAVEGVYDRGGGGGVGVRCG